MEKVVLSMDNVLDVVFQVKIFQIMSMIQIVLEVWRMFLLHLTSFKVQQQKDYTSNAWGGDFIL